ncbi:hypothetical protein ACOMHN_026867 [Nucella lapillus]
MREVRGGGLQLHTKFKPCRGEDERGQRRGTPATHEVQTLQGRRRERSEAGDSSYTRSSNPAGEKMREVRVGGLQLHTKFKPCRGEDERGQRRGTPATHEVQTLQGRR